ncbi:MAG TPA: cysteine hydrolase [Anaerolineaceae bacterium]|jgi:nicotinamidase-related amidase|nr:cysteine hydrolase [Anaerolineaceae bacterium]
MATIRKGNQAVLLIVDVQVGVVEGAWEADRIIQNINTAVEKARSQDVPVVWVQHNGGKLKKDSPEWQIVPELSPQADDVIIQKYYNSSFEETNLEETLADLGVTRIVLAGAVTNWCIRATGYATLERGYDLTLIADGHMTGDLDLENGTTIPAEHIIQDLNTGMAWITYPGRESRVFEVHAVQFKIKHD